MALSPDQIKDCDIAGATAAVEELTLEDPETIEFPVSQETKVGGLLPSLSNRC